MSQRFAKLNKDGLKAELELYQKSGLEFELTGEETNPELVEKLETLLADHGVAHVVTAEDLSRPDFKDSGAVEGDVVLIEDAPDLTLEGILSKPQTAVLTDNERAFLIEHRADLEPEVDARLVEAGVFEAVPVAPPATPAEDRLVAPVAPVADGAQLWHAGKPVVRVENKIVNGKLYKEVFTAEATFLLSEEQFASEVSSR